ncbi:MAG: hypothetical protein AAGC99_03920 [Pseudomonadota bacterium]
MTAAMNIDAAVNDFSALLGELTSTSTFSRLNIEELRTALFRQGGVDRRCAAEIFHANRTITPEKNGEWSEFYLEVLTGFFLQYQSGRYILPAEFEDLLVAWLGEGTSIDHVNERRLTLRILLRVTNTPDRIERRVLGAVSSNLLSQSERWLGNGQRSPGVLDALDMQLIRRLVCRAEGHYQRNCSRAAIVFLLKLNEQMEGFADPEGWRQLILHCAARHLSVELKKDFEGPMEPSDKFELWAEGLSYDGCSFDRLACLRDDIFSEMRRVSELCDKV